MLVLSRHADERIFLTLPDGSEIIVTAVSFDRGKFKIGIDAPKDVVIEREEVRERRLAGEPRPT